MYAQHTAALSTPIGTVHLHGTASTLTGIRLTSHRTEAHRGTAPALVEAYDQLLAWFEGRLREFDLPLAPPKSSRGGVLRDGIAAVGYAQTASYGALARKLASSPRAVGQACARNPFPIVVPCHRILASGGELGPYSAGDGPATKRWLLDHERHHV